MTELLSGTDLCLLRGDRCLFKGLNFALSAGELMLVRGPNGSGKTSLLRSIAGLIGLEKGYISWQGAPTEKDRQSFSSDVVWMTHRVGFKADLTLVENLRFETGLRWLWSAKGELFGNMNFVWGKETFAGGRTDPADRIPPLNGRIGGAYQISSQFRVESFVRFATRQDRLSPRDQSDSRINPDGTPGWVTLNVRSSYDFGEGLIARVSLENVLDQPYREHGSGINAPGINAIFSIEASL